MKKTFEYTKHTFLNEYCAKQSNSWDYLCGDGVERYFDIPENTKHIWVTVSDEPMEESYKCRLNNSLFKEIILTLSNGSYRPVSIASDVYYKIERLFGIGVTFYVRVEY